MRLLFTLGRYNRISFLGVYIARYFLLIFVQIMALNVLDNMCIHSEHVHPDRQNKTNGGKHHDRHLPDERNI